MQVEVLDEAIELLGQANAGLEPELLTATDARTLMERYARIVKLGEYGVAALARKLDDAAEIARVTGTSVAKARVMAETGAVLGSCDELSSALQQGEVSLDQAAHIATAEKASPGAARELVAVAQTKSFQVLRETARKTAVEALQYQDVFSRQKQARLARHYSDDLGMMHIDLCLEPHVGAPIVARAEAEAARLATAAKAKDGGRDKEPFARHLADSYAALLAGSGQGRTKRPELVVLVSHEVAKRGWTDVRRGEVCKIPELGPWRLQLQKRSRAMPFCPASFTTEKTSVISRGGRGAFPWKCRSRWSWGLRRASTVCRVPTAVNVFEQSATTLSRTLRGGPRRTPTSSRAVGAPPGKDGARPQGREAAAAARGAAAGGAGRTKYTSVEARLYVTESARAPRSARPCETRVG